MTEPSTRFVRAPEHDRRVRRGDDFAGDAWRDRDTGEIKYVAVGVEPQEGGITSPTAYLYRKAGYNDTVSLTPNGVGAELGWDVVPLVSLATYALLSPGEMPPPAIAFLYRKAGYNDTVSLTPDGVGVELGWDVIPLVISPAYTLAASSDAPSSASHPKLTP